MARVRNVIDESIRVALTQSDFRQTPDTSFSSAVGGQLKTPSAPSLNTRTGRGLTGSAQSAARGVDSAVADVFDQVRAGLADAERLLVAQFPRLATSVSPDLAAAKLHLQNVVRKLS